MATGKMLRKDNMYAFVVEEFTLYGDKILSNFPFDNRAQRRQQQQNEKKKKLA